VIAKKASLLDAHVSQYYEWMPWHAGALDRVPKEHAARIEWLKKDWIGEPSPVVREALVKWYGPERGRQVKFAEAFEICEYGARPSQAEIRRLFPFFAETSR
jgi:hypothetical protein